MKVLVTGISGQLGRALLANAPDWADCFGVDRAACDLANESAVARVIAAHRPDMLINAAAYTAVDRAETDEAAALAVNGLAVGEMVRALDEYGGRLVQVSTDFVFDGAGSTPYAPDHPTNPLSAYGRTKAAGEAAAGSNALVVRTSWVHAAGGSNFVRTMLRLMRERDEVRVVADQIGAPTWATGLAATIWGLAQGKSKGVFHHCDAGVASWYDFAVAIQQEALALGLLDRQALITPIPTRDYPTPAKRPQFSLLDSSATLSLLGLSPVHWRTHLRQMLQEEKQSG